MSLEDLDELVLRCRDEKAKLYIAEAVSSYRAGAFRSAIVATWIAVCFDIIDKLRELAIAGDAEAEKQVHEINLIRGGNDLSRALKFEKGLLILAKDKFEILSLLEFVDLERLQMDRNRCAHPSLTADDQAYTPSAELARLHLHSAVVHLLQHPPVQGKYALSRLEKEIESEYFPSNSKSAKEFFSAGPLKKPRESLVKNITIILLKALSGGVDWNRRLRLSAALQAIRELHPGPCDKVFKEKLSPIFRAIKDGGLLNALRFLESVPDVWVYFEFDVKERLQNFILCFSGDYLGELEFLLTYSPLQLQAKNRLNRATKKELQDALFVNFPVELGDRYVDLYLQSKSFDEANDLGKIIGRQAKEFNANHVRKILKNAAANDQIKNSYQIGFLLLSLQAGKILPEDEFDSLIKDNGLYEFLIA